ncbi:hypothetical protein FPQ18DRAFT_322731 [Pyronema domesticum]|nr:hypothetical protein FPQ18DRAFT_322731 [Pyronema domesticum]
MRLSWVFAVMHACICTFLQCDHSIRLRDLSYGYLRHPYNCPEVPDSPDSLRVHFGGASGMILRLHRVIWTNCQMDHLVRPLNVVNLVGRCLNLLYRRLSIGVIRY